jgi:hypothetical protein
VDYVVTGVPRSLASEKRGKNIGKRSVWFNGKSTKAKTEHVKPQYKRYVAKNFLRILLEEPN